MLVLNESGSFYGMKKRDELLTSLITLIAYTNLSRHPHGCLFYFVECGHIIQIPEGRMPYGLHFFHI